MRVLKRAPVFRLNPFRLSVSRTARLSMVLVRHIQHVKTQSFFHDLQPRLVGNDAPSPCTVFPKSTTRNSTRRVVVVPISASAQGVRNAVRTAVEYLSAPCNRFDKLQLRPGRTVFLKNERVPLWKTVDNSLFSIPIHNRPSINRSTSKNYVTFR